MDKVKFMCSYGGKIQHRPRNIRFFYSGGHTKIITVDRPINFSNLISKLHNLCDYDSEFQLKYKLPGQDLDALISVFDDDDVNHMMLEYDLLRQVSTKPERFRLFLFFSATVTAKTLNPDFLFGFDEEYSLKNAAVEPLALMIPENMDTVGSASGAPKQNPGILVRDSYVYPEPLVYRVPVNACGYFQAGRYDGV